MLRTKFNVRRGPFLLANWVTVTYKLTLPLDFISFTLSPA